MDDILDNSRDTVLPQLRKYERLYQSYLDRSVPHLTARWASFGGLLFLFFVRILVAQGWYIVCYALGIYLLNLFLLFLQPKFDPSLEQELEKENLEEGDVGAEADDDAGVGSSSRAGDDDDREFRPFIRRLPEFKFWYNGVRATAAALFCSFFAFFDIPVFWPILLMYFIILFVLTMRRQLQHMIKYRYLPFDLGKAKYNRG